MNKEIELNYDYLAWEYKGYYTLDNNQTEIHGTENKNINELHLLVIFDSIQFTNTNEWYGWAGVDLEDLGYELSNAELMEYLNDDYEMENITFDEVIKIIKTDERQIADFAFSKWCKKRK